MRISSLLVVSLLFAAGCASGDYRRLDLSEDMTPGDRAHYEQLATDDDGPMEDYFGGLPSMYLPLYLRMRTSDADDLGEGRFHYHFEDDASFLFIVAHHSETANFDDTGRNLTYESRYSLLLNAFAMSHGHRSPDRMHSMDLRSFSILWGLLGYERNTWGNSWSLLWIPF